MASEEVFNYHNSGLWLVLSLSGAIFRAKHAPTSKTIALKIVKWKLPWKEVDFTDLVKDVSQLHFFLLATYFVLDCIKSHKYGLAAETVSKWQPPKSIFQDKFLQDTGLEVKKPIRSPFGN